MAESVLSGQNMDRRQDTERIVAAIRYLIDLTELPSSEAAYHHMGALIVDASLQAGLSYSTVVAPRVDRVLTAWPSADTTSRFLDCCLRWGLVDVLQWTHPEKLQRALRLTMLLRSARVETVQDLAQWAPSAEGRRALLGTSGIGPKTADYIAGLAGAPSVAIDRHLVNFAREAGVSALEYEALADLYRSAACELGVALSALDRAIWAAMAERPRAAAPLDSDGSAHPRPFALV